MRLPARYWINLNSAIKVVKLPIKIIYIYKMAITIYKVSILDNSNCNSYRSSQIFFISL